MKTTQRSAAVSPGTMPMLVRVLRDGVFLAGAALGAIATVGVVTVAEGFWARARLVPNSPASFPPAQGMFGDPDAGPPIELVMMGDSLAVGYGAADPSETVGVILATSLASTSGRPVRLRNVAWVGAEASDLPAQLQTVRQAGPLPNVVVIVIGGNDVMHLKSLADALLPLRATVNELHRSGTKVVVATCPDLGTVRPFFQPLRFFAHWLSRFLATSQTIVVLRAGGRTVSLADTLGPLFHRDPTAMFSELDHLHPSGLGYAQAAEAVLPSVRAAAGYPTPTDGTAQRRVYRKRGIRPLVWLAFRATRRIGSQLHTVNGTQGDVVGIEPDAAGPS